MSSSDQDSARGASGLPRAIERKLVSGARQTDRAMAVGNRAGVIEWVNDAWTRVTGYALDESLGKPVHAFLRAVDVDPSVVDFVAGCFAQGKACEVEIPLAPPQREPLWILLRVEPLFDANEEVSDFIATATDMTQQRNAEMSAGLSEVDLSELAIRVARGQLSLLGDMIEFDLALPADLPPVLADETLVERLLEPLIARGIESIGEGWGTVSLSTGILGSNASPIFRGNFCPRLPDAHWAYLEMHVSGCFPSGGDFSLVTEPFLSTAFASNAIHYANAESQLRKLGAEVRMESCPVFGTSVILLFRFAGEDSGWIG